MDTTKRMPWTWHLFQAWKGFWSSFRNPWSTGSNQPNNLNHRPTPQSDDSRGQGAATTTAEWERLDSSGTGSNVSFARTGGGRDDTRPPDFDAYVVIGLPGSGTIISSRDGGNETDVVDCIPEVVVLNVHYRCPDGTVTRDRLRITRIPTFNIGDFGDTKVASSGPGEYVYITTDPGTDADDFISFIPETAAVGRGAIRIEHRERLTMQQLGVQFLMRLN
ncbi:MAG: hypothetical protein AAGN35_22725 [Bacteroidota bacterium]